MPDAALTQLCELLITALNGGSFSQSFTAVRVYSPVLDRDKIGSTINVLVAPAKTTIDWDSRGSKLQQYYPQVAVVSACDASNTDQVDALIYFVDELIEAVGNLYPFTLSNTANDPIYDPELLVTKSVFQSVLTFTYRAERL